MSKSYELCALTANKLSKRKYARTTNSETQSMVIVLSKFGLPMAYTNSKRSSYTKVVCWTLSLRILVKSYRSMTQEAQKASETRSAGYIKTYSRKKQKSLLKTSCYIGLASMIRSENL